MKRFSPGRDLAVCVRPRPVPRSRRERLPRPVVGAAVVTGTLVVGAVLAGCGNAGLGGSADIALTYADENGQEQQLTIRADATVCTDDITPDRRRLATADGTVAALVDPRGDAQVMVKIDDELTFQSTVAGRADRRGFRLEDVEGIVVRIPLSGMQKKVSEGARATGTLSCPR